MDVGITWEYGNRNGFLGDLTEPSGVTSSSLGPKGTGRWCQDASWFGASARSGAAMALTVQEVILWPVAGLPGGRPPRTASTPDCTCTHARVRHAFPSCGTDGAWRLRRSSPSRSALSTAHRGSLAGTSWAWALPGCGSWLVSSWGACSALAPGWH